MDFSFKLYLDHEYILELNDKYLARITKANKFALSCKKAVILHNFQSKQCTRCTMHSGLKCKGAIPLSYLSVLLCYFP